jgi:hypothetical protein
MRFALLASYFTAISKLCKRFLLFCTIILHCIKKRIKNNSLHAQAMRKQCASNAQAMRKQCALLNNAL